MGDKGAIIDVSPYDAELITEATKHGVLRADDIGAAIFHLGICDVKRETFRLATRMSPDELSDVMDAMKEITKLPINRTAYLMHCDRLNDETKKRLETAPNAALIGLLLWAHTK